ncbi:unnamed protein product, partial [Choristocarpus tenellus]
TPHITLHYTPQRPSQTKARTYTYPRNSYPRRQSNPTFNPHGYHYLHYCTLYYKNGRPTCTLVSHQDWEHHTL